MSIKFEQGVEYYPLRKFGIRRDEKMDGLVLSERDHSMGSVETSMGLIYADKIGGAPYFFLPEEHPLCVQAGDRVMVRSHRNHFDAGANYNAARNAGATGNIDKRGVTVPASGPVTQKMIEFREAQVETARVNLKKEENLLAQLQQRWTDQKAQRPGAPAPAQAGTSDAVKRALNPENPARIAARKALEAARAQAEELKARMPGKEKPVEAREPTSDEANALIEGVVAQGGGTQGQQEPTDEELERLTNPAAETQPTEQGTPDAAAIEAAQPTEQGGQAPAQG